MTATIEEVIEVDTEDERIPTSQVMRELGVSARTVYRMAEPDYPAWQKPPYDGRPPLSDGVVRDGSKELWWKRSEVEAHKSRWKPRRRATMRTSPTDKLRDTG